VLTEVGAERSELDSRQWQGIVPFTTASRPALEPTHPPMKLVPGGKVAGA
jgi:hypothetical protein